MSRQDLAREAQVTAGAVTRQCEPGGRLFQAVRGTRVDADHPDAVAWVAERRDVATAQALMDAGVADADGVAEAMGVDAAYARGLVLLARQNGFSARGGSTGWTARRQSEKASAPGDDLPMELPEHMTPFLDMTLADLIARFGTDVRFKDWLDAVNKIEMIINRRAANAEKEGRLVARELVEACVDVFDSAHRKLLTDGARNISRKLPAMVRTGRTTEEMEAYVVDIVGSFVRGAKDRALARLKAAG